MALEHFNQFIASLESMNMNPDVDQLSMKDQYALDSVYGTVKNFITETNLVPADQIAAMESFEQPMRSFNRNVSLADIGTDRIIDLCRQCGITDNNLKAACESVSLAIHNYTNGYNAAQHFNSAAPSGSHGELDVRKFDTCSLLAQLILFFQLRRLHSKHSVPISPIPSLMQKLPSPYLFCVIIVPLCIV